MKLRHLFATLSLAIVAGAGVAAGLSSGNAQKAKAYFDGGRYVYLKTDVGNWNQAAARFSVYYFDVSKNNKGWIDMALYDSSLSIYEAKLPANASNDWTIIFCRMNPHYGTNQWNTDQENDHVWNQTGDLSTDEGREYYKISPNGGYPGDTGEWLEPYYGSRNFTWYLETSTDGFQTSNRTEVPFAVSGRKGESYLSVSLTAGTEFKFVRSDDLVLDWDNRVEPENNPTMAHGGIVASTDSDGNFRAKSSSSYELFVKPNGTIWIQSDATEDAKTFASGFKSAIEGNCPYDYSSSQTTGKTASDLVNAWKNQSIAYNDLTEGAKEVLESATTSSAGSLADFARVYDYVYGHYAGVREAQNGGNFANRTVSIVANLSNPIAQLGAENSYTSIIAIIGAVSLVAIGGFFFIRRKRA